MKPVYSNDRKAPRMRKAKFSTNIISRELWKDFRKEYPEHRNMSWEVFYKAWTEIAQTIREEGMTNPLGVKLGNYTGEIKLQWLQHKMFAPSPALSEQLGEKVNHPNIAERGKVAKIKWERRWAVKFNKMLQFYAFTPTREMNKIADDHIGKNVEKLRMSRNTLGGYSVWRQLKANRNGK